MNISFCEIEESDNRYLADLIRSVFREFGIDRPGTVYYDPSTDNLWELFRTPRSVYWVARHDTEIIGGCGVFPTPGLPDGCAELVKLYLLPAWRGRGIGRRLMELSVDSAREFGYRQLYLESLPELEKAVSLYQKAGFSHINHPLGNSGHFGCNIWMTMDL